MGGYAWKVWSVLLSFHMSFPPWRTTVENTVDCFSKFVHFHHPRKQQSFYSCTFPASTISLLKKNSVFLLVLDSILFPDWPTYPPDFIPKPTARPHVWISWKTTFTALLRSPPPSGLTHIPGLSTATTPSLSPFASTLPQRRKGCWGSCSTAPSLSHSPSLEKSLRHSTLAQDGN